MNKLKALLVVCMLSLGFVGASAQGLNWGVKAGLNVSSVSEDGLDFKPGFNVGVIGQYMFSGAEGFGIESGLQYSMLGYKYDVLDESETINSSYLQLPIQAIYKMNAGLGLYLYPSAGIYLGYGIGGTDDFFDYAEAFDFGVKIGMNLQYDKLLIGVGYEQGLTEVVKDSDAKNQNLVVSVGYLF